MHDNTILRVRTTIEQMQRLLHALASIGEDLPKNPRLYALLAEGPLDLIVRMAEELDQHLTELKQPPVATAS